MKATRRLNVDLAVWYLPLLWMHRDVTIHRLYVTHWYTKHNNASVRQCANQNLFSA